MIPYPPKEKSYREARNDAIESDQFAQDVLMILVDYMDEDSARVIGYNLAHVRTSSTEEHRIQYLVAAAKALLNAIDSPMEKALTKIMDNDDGPDDDSRLCAAADLANDMKWQEDVDRGRT